MFEKIKHYLTKDDFLELNRRYKEFKLNEDEILTFVDGLPSKNSRYIYSALISNIAKGRFVSQIVVKDFYKSLDFTDYWKTYNIEPIEPSRHRVEYLILAIYNLTDNIKELHHSTDKIIELYHPKTTDEMYSRFCKSKLIKKYQIDVEQKREEADQDLKEWEQLLSVLEGDDL